MFAQNGVFSPPCCEVFAFAGKFRPSASRVLIAVNKVFDTID